MRACSFRGCFTEQKNIKMVPKKSERANLEKNKGLYFQLGLLITVSLILIAFEWTSGGLGNNIYDTASLEQMEEEIIPITRQQEPEPPKPPEPPKVTEVLNIVDDDVEIDDELQLDDFEVDQDQAIEIIKYVEEEEEEDVEIFYVVEDMPKFRGQSMEAFYKFVGEKLEYPMIAMENGIAGKVFVSFIIDKDGKVKNAYVVRGVDPSLDKEALRVVNASPNWTPGKQRGRPVQVSLTLPIAFSLI